MNGKAGGDENGYGESAFQRLVAPFVLNEHDPEKVEPVAPLATPVTVASTPPADPARIVDVAGVSGLVDALRTYPADKTLASLGWPGEKVNAQAR